MVELFCDTQLVVDGQREPFLLGAVPQGGVEDVDRGGKPGKVEVVATLCRRRPAMPFALGMGVLARGLRVAVDQAVAVGMGVARRPPRPPVNESSLSVGPSFDIVQPVLVLVHFTVQGGEERLLDLLGDRPRSAITHHPVVDCPDRHQLRGRAGKKCLVGRVEVGPDDRLIGHRVAEVAGDRLDRLLGDSLEGSRIGRRGVISRPLRTMKMFSPCTH